jgi:glucose-6-phosphate 1-dehydrogenase
VQPLLDEWGATKPANFPNYAAGSWGPDAADDLLARDGFRWLMPTGINMATGAAPGFTPPGQ